MRNQNEYDAYSINYYNTAWIIDASEKVVHEIWSEAFKTMTIPILLQCLQLVSNLNWKQ